MTLNIRHKYCVIVLCILFCVYWSEMLRAHLYVPPIRARYVNVPYVELTVSEIV